MEEVPHHPGDWNLAFFHINKREHNVRGFWGPVDAVHQFCEPHYNTTIYLAECWNALSSLWYIYLAYRLLSQNQNKKRTTSWIQPALAGWLATVGVGSFLFHGTMRRSMQLLDEGPMIGSLGTAIWWKVGLHPLTRDRVVLWRSLSTALHVAIILLYVWLGSYELFVNGFTAMVILDAFLGFSVRKDDVRWRNQCVRMILVARVFWEIENKWCETYPSVWVAHIVWHIFSGLAAYYGVLFNISLEDDDREEHDDVVKKQT